MHELSIARSLIEIAEGEAKRLAVEVEAVHVKIGALSGVVDQALLYAYDIAVEGTALEGSRLVICSAGAHLLSELRSRIYSGGHTEFCLSSMRPAQR